MTLPLTSVSKTRTTHLLAKLHQARILVIGDLMLDRYLMGDVDRISPEAPVPVVNVVEEWNVPGGAANVGANVAAMGASCRLIGAIGHDDAGEILRTLIDAHGLPTDGVLVTPGRTTTTKTRILARGQQVVRIDREVTTPLPASHRDMILTLAREAVRECQAMILEDYDKGVFDHELIGQLMAMAQEAGIPVVVDPKIRHFFAYTGATVFKPNRRELEFAFANRPGHTGEDLVAAREQLGVDHLLVTMGSEGMCLVSAGTEPQQVASIARDVFDVSGAGDTVTAWLAGTLAAGATIGEAAWLANLAAGVEVGKRGTATVSQHELLEAMESANRG